MNSVVVLFFLFGLTSVSSASDICAVNQDAKVEKSIPVPDGVNYFIRGAPTTGEVGFATSKGNFILDTKKGIMVPFPGEIDPVLTPDGKIISIPQTLYFDPKSKKYTTEAPSPFDGYHVKNGQVYRCKDDGCNVEPEKMTVEEVRRSGKPFKAQVMTFYLRDNVEGGPIHYDQFVNENYQSFGALRTHEGVTSYRMLYETSNGLAIRDYQLEGKTFKSTGPVKTVCEGKRGFIPAITKSGDEYAAYDPETGVTQVFEIGKSGYECKLKDTIPGLVGKVDFSPNGKFIAYHIDHKQDRNNTKGVITKADDRNNIEVVVFDREAKLPRTVALSDKTNSYYPVFLDDNTLAYIISSKPKDWQTKPNFAIQLASLTPASTPNCPECYAANSNSGQLAATIGVIRLRRCQSEPDYYYKNAISSFSQLKPSQCKNLVANCDKKCFEDIKISVQKVSSSGGASINGIPLRSRQQWNLKNVSDVDTNKLNQFCDGFIKANAGDHDRQSNTTSTAR